MPVTVAPCRSIDRMLTAMQDGPSIGHSTPGPAFGTHEYNYDLNRHTKCVTSTDELTWVAKTKMLTVPPGWQSHLQVKDDTEQRIRSFMPM